MSISLELRYTLSFIAVFIVCFLSNVRKRKRLSPKKPWITCFIDSLLSIPQYLKLGTFRSPNDIINALGKAIKTTGLKNLGGFDNGLSMIQRYEVCRNKGLENAGGKLKYSPIGFLASKELLTKRMETRLKLVDYFNKHPSIESIEKNSIKAPIFVIGFPRTGTTFLHELLGLHPKVRSHYSWQQSEPVPRTDVESTEALRQDRSDRYNDKSKKFKFNLLLTLAGEEFQSIHRVGYEEPEECTTPCALELPWAILELPLNVFAAKEVFELGAGDAFEFYKKYLQLLSWCERDITNINNGSSNNKNGLGGAADDIRWMLKCPFHLPYLDELYETFPDATVVWTHRDPCECIASACSLYESLMHMAFESSTVDRVALGKAVVDYSKRALDKAFETFNNLSQKNKNDKNKNKIIHIRYSDNIKSPKTTCQEIVEKAGIGYSDEYQTNIDNYLAKNAKERSDKMKSASKKVMHEYSLEDYGLSVESVSATFADYIAEYKLTEDKKKKKEIN